MLEDFIDEVHGKPFELSIKKLRKRQTMATGSMQRPSLESASSATSKSEETKQSTSRFVEEDRTFFCSELIAKCYKVLGLLKDTNEASSRFHPWHFSKARDKTDLIDGAVLGEE